MQCDFFFTKNELSHINLFCRHFYSQDVKISEWVVISNMIKCLGKILSELSKINRLYSKWHFENYIYFKLMQTTIFDMVLGKSDTEKEIAKKNSKGKKHRRNVQSWCEFEQAGRWWWQQYNFEEIFKISPACKELNQQPSRWITCEACSTRWQFTCVERSDELLDENEGKMMTFMWLIHMSYMWIGTFTSFLLLFSVNGADSIFRTQCFMCVWGFFTLASVFFF